MTAEMCISPGTLLDSCSQVFYQANRIDYGTDTDLRIIIVIVARKRVGAKQHAFLPPQYRIRSTSESIAELQGPLQLLFFHYYTSNTLICLSMLYGTHTYNLREIPNILLR